MNKKTVVPQVPLTILAAAAALGVQPGPNQGIAEARNLVKKLSDPKHRHCPRCPRCDTRRTWVVDGRWRCRDCGTRFDVVVPEDAKNE